MSFPPPIAALKLSVSNSASPNAQSFEQNITSVTYGITRVQITNSDLLDAFNNLPAGTKFTPSIITIYNPSTFPSGDVLSTPSDLYFVPRKIIPTLSLADIPNKLTTDLPFSLSASSVSTGVLAYQSSAIGVATVSSSGNVTIVGAGTTTITVNQAASLDGVYAAALPVSQQLVVSAPPTLELVAFYPFDSNGVDASTNNNNLTNYNTVTFDTVNFRRGSGAASFNGSNYFEIANDGKFSPDNFTVGCWIKPVDSAGNFQSIASCRNGYSPNLSGWMIYIHPDNNLQFWTGNGSSWSGGSENLFSGFGNLNRWVHLVFTFNKATGSLVMYVDGTLTTTVSRSYTNTTVNSLRIGAGATEQNAQFFLRNGTLLDDFRFYSSVLTASQVSAMYSN
jgi:hypothetical protein